MNNFSNVVKEGNWYFWYQYSAQCSIHNFDVTKYKKMNIKNPMYVYSKDGFLLAVICGETKKETVREIKKYIRRSIVISLLKGSDDYNFDVNEKNNMRKDEWKNLVNHIKNKFHNHGKALKKDSYTKVQDQG